MSLVTTIEEGIKNVEKERTLIDKMLTYIEREDSPRFERYTEYFNAVREKTDGIINSLLDSYSIDEIFNYLNSTSGKRKQEELLTCTTFCDLLTTTNYNNVSRRKRHMDVDSMSEEHTKELFNVYLWGIKNEQIPEEEKRILHTFMLEHFSSSRFVRYYFSGEYKAAMNLSNPDLCFGRVNADEIANQVYYSILNKLVNQSNCTEMYDDFENHDAFNARRRFIKYDLMAVNNLLEKRNLAYPILNNEPSDFTYDVLTDASASVEEFKKSKRASESGKRITVIYL